MDELPHTIRRAIERNKRHEDAEVITELSRLSVGDSVVWNRRRVPCEVVEVRESGGVVEEVVVEGEGYGRKPSRHCLESQGSYLRFRGNSGAVKVLRRVGRAEDRDDEVDA